MNRLFGVAAIIGGLLKIFVTFIRTASDKDLLETLYIVADLGLLFGLIGMYFMFRDRFSVLGNIGFVLALAGLSFVVGPDAYLYGKSTSEIAMPVIGAGMLLFAFGQLLISGHPKLAPGIVLISVAVSVLDQVISMTFYAQFTAGMLFGFGFILYGAYLIRQ